MLKSILVGVGLTVVTVGIHATGTSWYIGKLRRAGIRSIKDERPLNPIYVLCWTSTLLLSLHILEVTIWAIAYLLLPDIEAINTIETAVYFSTVTFTTLGYGDVVIENSWRLLSAIQAMAGLLLFGWSAGFFLAVFQQFWNVSEKLSRDDLINEAAETD